MTKKIKIIKKNSTIFDKTNKITNQVKSNFKVLINIIFEKKNYGEQSSPDAERQFKTIQLTLKFESFTGL